MDDHAKKFARRVLLVHALLLLVVVGVVFFAARAVFQTASRQVIEQKEREQSQLAEQTAEGISFFDSIRSDLDLLRRTDSEEPTTQPVSGSINPASTQPAFQITPAPLAPQRLPGRMPGTRPAIDAGQLTARAVIDAIAGILWQQLQTRATMLLIVEREALFRGEPGRLNKAAVHVVGPVEQFNPMLRAPTVAVWQEALEIVDKSQVFLRSVDQPTISPFQNINSGGNDSGGVALVCIPMQERRKRVLVASFITPNRGPIPGQA